MTEIRAGLVTFFTMAYIISVNASIVSDTGGTCVCNGPTTGPAKLQDPFCTSTDTSLDYMVEYSLCSLQVKRDLVTATAAISALSSFCMGLFANLPIGLAPGMGMCNVILCATHSHTATNSYI